MRLVNTTPYTAAPIPVRVVAQRPSVSFVVKGTFRLVPGGRAVRAEAQRFLSGDLHRGDDPAQDCLYAGDFAPYKPRTDLLLAGTCHVPGGVPATVCQVTFGVGAWSKTLVAVGSRRWERGPLGRFAGDPQPFTRVALDYAQAFGGAEHPFNRAGKGCGNDELPRVEDPRQLVTRGGDRPFPAGFGPIARTWPARAALRGTYDRAWLRENWPWAPRDFDHRHENAAPEDQQRDAPLSGDEEIVLVHLRPDHARFVSRLPGVRVRCFLDRDEVGAPGFREVALRLDTLFVDADALEAVLVWRGIAATATDDPDEVGTLVVVEETTDDAPRPSAEYAPLAVPASPPAPVEAPVQARPEAPAPADPLVEVPELGGMLAALGAFAQESGVTFDPAAGAAPPDDPADALAAVLAEFRDRLAAAGVAEPAALAGAFATVDALRAERPLPERAPDAGGWTRERVAAAKADGTSLRGASLAGLDLSGLSLAGLDLAGADLVAATLSGCDLAGATLAGADLSRARLGAAALRGAQAARALFVEADLTGADLSGAVLDGADLSASTLDGAILGGASLVDATLEGAHGQGVDLQKARIARLHAAGAELPGLRAAQAEGEGAIFSGAQLEGADFTAALLPRAQFVKVRAARARFERADLRNAVLRGAVLTGASFAGADVLRGSFERADLRAADLSRANLYQAEFWQSVRDAVRLTGANVAGSKLA